MSFISIEFAALFLIFLTIYWACAPSVLSQNILLLSASYAFIASFSWYAVLVLFCYSVCVYLLAIFAQKLKQHFYYLLTGGLIIGTFSIFKYYDSIRSSISSVFEIIGLTGPLPIIDIIVPIGLSFYLFHSLSYLVEVGKRTIAAQPLWVVLLYLAFFPSVVSGPINRPYHPRKNSGLLQQIRCDAPRQLLFPEKSVWLILLATFKLWVLSAFLADTFVNPVFDAPTTSASLDILIAIYAYAFQIYVNFSGYSELVLAIGFLLGFQLPINFNTPYLATNLKEFWDRWHISLSECIRDYIYIPLGGSRKGFSRTQLHVFIAMLLSGIWHGVGFTFVIWGGLHGIGLIIYNLYVRQQSSLSASTAASKQAPPSAAYRPWLMRLATFHFICLTWIFFRANSVEDALEILWRLLDIFSYSFTVENSITLLVFWSIIAYYPSIIYLYHRLLTPIILLRWRYFGLIMLLLAQLIITIAPSGVPGFIYAQF